MNQQPKMLIALFSVCLAIIIGFFWSYFSSSSQEQKPSVEHAAVKDKKMPPDLAGGDNKNDYMGRIIIDQKSITDENRQMKEKIASLDKQLNEERQYWSDKFKSSMNEIKGWVAGNTSQNSVSSYSSKQEEDSNSADTSREHTNSMITDVPDLAADPILEKIASKGHYLDGDDSPKLPSENKPVDENENKKTKLPYISIPKTSTFADVKLMTPIIAEIPVASKLLAPAFPFKAIVGRKHLLAANGATLPPEVSGMMLEGYSVGDMSLGCARGYITDVLFVFNDGHFVTYPEKSEINATEIYPKDAVGYIGTSQSGLTCIPGKYIGNADKVIPKLAALAGASGAAQALSQSQLTTLSNVFQTNQAVTGNVAKYMLGASGNEMAKETLEWYKQRVHDVFDAIYIPSSEPITPESKLYKATTITVNIINTIDIDYDTKGRALRYEDHNKAAFINTHLD